MNKKLYTGLFVLIATVLNLIFTVALIIAFIIAGTFVLKHILHIPETSQAYGIVIIGALVAGVVVAFIVYIKVTHKLMVKYNMDEKLEDNWFGRKKTDEKGKPVERKKTRMPSSVLLTDDEQAERSKWGE